MEDNISGFKVDWYAGARAQLELFSVPTGIPGSTKYGLKYTPPIRGTLRPPVQEPALGREELDPIGQGLDSLVTTLQSVANRQRNSGPASSQGADVDEAPKETPNKKMAKLGWQLASQLIPQYINADLRKGGFFLEIGMDEELQGYPWELMYDGDNFICLKHYLGRYVNVSKAPVLTQSRQMDSSSDPRELSILIISVPRPLPRPTGMKYEYLPEAEAETKAILEALQGIPGVNIKLLMGRKEATFDNVFDELKSKEYQIIHFNGHANYNDKDPSRSALVLDDQDMNARQVASFFSNPPILCFINACETARTAQPLPDSTAQPVQNSLTWQNSYDVFGLARAFLEKGSYLLGSRWKLGDKAAAAFAKEFYLSLIKEQKPVGHAVTSARKVCQSASPEDHFSWASYVFYGDPRVYFRSTSMK